MEYKVSILCVLEEPRCKLEIPIVTLEVEENSYLKVEEGNILEES